jgi:hypothetical protein
MLNVKYLLTPANAGVPEALRDRFELKHRSDMGIFEIRGYLPRAFVVHDYRTAADDAEAIDVMLRDDFDVGRAAVMSGPLPGFQRASLASGLPDTPLKISRPSSDRIEITSHLGDHGILVVSEQFFPGWEAWVDGQPSEIHKVNSTLMGIVVPAGDHQVSLRFFPKAIRNGFAVAGLGGMSCLVLLFLDWMRHTRRVKPVQDISHRGPRPKK